jgi:transcriptional regulator with XRE-family HTH domain
MGLGKDKGSSRINRYEHQVTAIGFDNLDKLAEVLDVPIAYLVAENPAMADGILELSRVEAAEQERLVLALRALMASPPLAEAIARLASAPDEERAKLTVALSSLVSPPAKTRGK